MACEDCLESVGLSIKDKQQIYGTVDEVQVVFFKCCSLVIYCDPTVILTMDARLMRNTFSHGKWQLPLLTGQLQ